MKIVTILGARPQFIKAGSVSREIKSREKSGIDISEIIVHTGQHYDPNMSDIFFNQMEIPKPDYLLKIQGRSHGSMTGEMIGAIEKILQKETPDYVLVYGDTNSTLAGAIAASKLGLCLVHIEAGLRSFNMNMPEEINRIITDRISNFLFCPSDVALMNLNNEGIDNWATGSKIYNVGDVMYDGVLYYKSISKKPKNLSYQNNFILATIHRAENTDNYKKLKDIFEALNKTAKNIQVILPLHPRTKKNLSRIDTDNITIIEPVGYLEMIWLLEKSDIVLTDSGGLQKEAFYFGKPCITLRNETEWTELVDCGVNVLTGSDRDLILKTIKRMLENNLKFPKNIYGDGNASKKIVDCLIEQF